MLAKSRETTVLPKKLCYARREQIARRQAKWQSLTPCGCWLFCNAPPSARCREAGESCKNQQQRSGLGNGAAAVECSATTAGRFAKVGSPQGVVGWSHRCAETVIIYECVIGAAVFPPG